MFFISINFNLNFFKFISKKILNKKKRNYTNENEIIVVGSSLSNDGDIIINKGNKDILIFKIR